MPNDNEKESPKVPLREQWLRSVEVCAAVVVMTATFYAAVTAHQALQTARTANETANTANRIAMGFQHAVALTSVNGPDNLVLRRTEDFTPDRPGNYLTVDNDGKVPIIGLSLVVNPNNIFEPGVWAKDRSWSNMRIPVNLQEELMPSGGVLIDLSPVVLRILRSVCPTLPPAATIKGAMMVVVEAMRDGDTLPVMTGLNDRKEILFTSSCTSASSPSLKWIATSKIYASPIVADLNKRTGMAQDGDGQAGR